MTMKNRGQGASELIREGARKVAPKSVLRAAIKGAKKAPRRRK